jgi:ubiquinone/menaquinone biosynthesis C-methylase UbiE
MNFKDLFSTHAKEYKQFRPTYPADLFKFLASLVENHHAAWDCATGNGQGAGGLAKYFSYVYATDASAAQIAEAERLENIIYSVTTAEDSKLADHSVSLVTVFQAFHWFDIDKFFMEVKRVLTPNGVIAIIGYNTAVTGITKVDEVYKTFCFDYLWEKNCWEMERDSLNKNYKSSPFPFDEISAPSFQTEMRWNYQDYLAYLNTWSAVKTHIKLYNDNPVETFVIPKIKDAWSEKMTPRSVKLPLIMRLGRV